MLFSFCLFSYFGPLRQRLLTLRLFVLAVRSLNTSFCCKLVRKCHLKEYGFWSFLVKTRCSWLLSLIGKGQYLKWWLTVRLYSCLRTQIYILFWSGVLPWWLRLEVKGTCYFANGLPGYLTKYKFGQEVLTARNWEMKMIRLPRMWF